ncbi:hypothetical protein ACJX0J_007764 [Zea mays]
MTVQRICIIERLKNDEKFAFPALDFACFHYIQNHFLYLLSMICVMPKILDKKRVNKDNECILTCESKIGLNLNSCKQKWEEKENKNKRKNNLYLDYHMVRLTH